MLNPVSSLQKLLDVNIPIIYIDDYDYARIDEIITQACGNNPDNIKEWNPASGNTYFNTKEPKGADKSPVSLREFLRNEYAAEYETPSARYIILREVGAYMEDPEVICLLSLISQRKLYDRNYDRSIIISDYGLTIPSKLMPYTSILNIEIPDDDEINRLIDEHLEANDVDRNKFTDTNRNNLMPSLRGLSLFEIDRVLDMAMSVNGSLGDEDKELILQQKKAQVRKSGLIDLIDVKEKLEDIGGLEILKQYLIDKSQIMANLAEARRHHISTPKGVFIVGMPGCGKSLCAKAAAAQFGCPLLKLDMGSMMGKYVGQSESNLRRAIKIAEAAAPCILWIDEIEKGFSGIGGNNDIMTRMFGYFLSWMQDKTSSVYVIATANNADNLPPELKRKGRFDEIFCVKLPTPKERKAIFEVHLKKRKQYLENLDMVVSETDGFNGADIESVVNEALESLFVEELNKRDKNQKSSEISVKLTVEKLKSIAINTISISKSCKTQIDNMSKVFKESSFKNASL
ncbi:MAG: AAA family ATPase [Muribaculaceae bacterium]|nr:AAA family ATPase [Muribaculaceae bacterium]